MSGVNRRALRAPLGQRSVLRVHPFQKDEANMTDMKMREPLTAEDRARFERYASEIFARMGLAINSPGGRDTPRRWVSALWDMTEGYDGDPKLSTLFPVECPVCPDEEKTHVVEGPIRFTGLCEHHVLPIRGSVWVGYLAAEKLIGVSKLTRITRLYSKRFTSQERLSHDIANEVIKDVKPRGVAVYIEAEHFCMQARGVRELSSHTGTLVMRGAYNQNPLLSQEFRLMVDRRSASPALAA
jgi:GTP cyclohydrolase I